MMQKSTPTNLQASPAVRQMEPSRLFCPVDMRMTLIKEMLCVYYFYISYFSTSYLSVEFTLGRVSSILRKVDLS
jgi:hypothetical protein